MSHFLTLSQVIGFTSSGIKGRFHTRKGEHGENCISGDGMFGREANFHGGFTEVSMDVGVTWVAKTQYVPSP